MKLLTTLATLLLLTSALTAGTVTLAWDPNPEKDLAGYRIYYGTESGNLVLLKDVGNVTMVTLTLPNGVYYFHATAYNTSNLESPYSGGQHA